MWTVAGWLIAFTIIIYRFFYFFDALLRNIYDPGLPTTTRLMLRAHGFWRKATKFVLDLTLTTVSMAGARIFIAGTASAPVGAIASLLLSASVTAGPWYKDRVKRQCRSA